MPKLPVISGLKCRKALERIGYRKDRQEGSHVIMTKTGCDPITIPMHEVIDRGTLRSIIRSSNITVQQFIWLLKK
jgi:predicted RNA binding protein YcfA (HicA-like mRNA interferase family)